MFSRRPLKMDPADAFIQQRHAEALRAAERRGAEKALQITGGAGTVSEARSRIKALIDDLAPEQRHTHEVRSHG